MLEPFISPGIFEEWREKTPAGGIDIIDEYTLCQAMGDEKVAALTAHYETFIVRPPLRARTRPCDMARADNRPVLPYPLPTPEQTEQDFVDIAAAGLNFVRIPIGFWAVETMDDEPFLQGVSWRSVPLSPRPNMLQAPQVADHLHARIPLDSYFLKACVCLPPVSFLSAR